MNSDEILDALSEKLDCQHYGSYLAAKCIFHDDSRPSLMIYPDKYSCLACGAYGKTEKLLERLTNTMLVQTKPDYRNPWSKWTRNIPLKDVLYMAFETLKETPSLGNYLHKRGINAKVCGSLGIGYRDDWFTIPITDRPVQGWGKIIGAVARANAETNNSPSRYIIPHGQSTDLLYVPSWKVILQSPYVYLTFGILDAITLCMLNKPAMSTTGGKRINPDALDWCRKEIRIIPDRGEYSDAKMIAKDLGWRGKVIDMNHPEDSKDCNDLLCHNHLELLENL